MLFRLLGVAAKGERVMGVAQLGEVAISAPAISADGRTCRHTVLDERCERFGVTARDNIFTSARDYSEAQPARIHELLYGDAALMGLLPFGAASFSVLASSDLDSADDCRLMVDASSLASQLREACDSLA